MKFNLLLRDAGLDPTDVKLVRHQDRRVPSERMPYELWRAGTFELYQRVQGKLRFAGARAIASFVATPLDETLFVGLYWVKGVSVVPAGTIDPSSLADVGGLNLYELEAATALADLRGRLIVDWGDGFRAWVQNAGNQDKEIVELRRTISDPPFPGFMKFATRLDALASVPRSWREALSSVPGHDPHRQRRTGRRARLLGRAGACAEDFRCACRRGYHARARHPFAPLGAVPALNRARAPYLPRGGRYEVTLVLGPVMDFVPGRGMRIAVAFDDEAPQVLDIFANRGAETYLSLGWWTQFTRDNARFLRSTHTLAAAGPHTLKVRMVDTGIVLQKVIICDTKLPESYFGPPANPRVE